MPKSRKKAASKVKKPNENMVIGQNVRALRTGAGLSLEEMAEVLHVTYQQVQKYETGTNRLPLHYIPVLCDLFGVPAEVFLDGLRTRKPKQDDDIVHVQMCIARVRDRTLREKIVQVVDILAA